MSESNEFKGSSETDDQLWTNRFFGMEFNIIVF